MKVKLFALWLMLATVSCTILPAQATVSTTAPRNDYIGTNATATYSYTFKIFAATDLRVTTRNTSGVETALAYTTDYTVTGVGSASGGTITLTAGNLATDYRLTIRFDRTPRQATDLRNQGSFFAETHESKFDELTRYSQQLEDVVDRSIHLPETEAGTAAATTLPIAALRGGKFFGWDGSGNPIAAAGTSADLTPVSTFINGLLDDVDAATARTTLGAASDAAVDARLDADELILDSVKQAVRNPIINGNLDIWQRGTSFAAVADGTYTADRWRWRQSGAGVVTINRSTNVPSVAQAGQLFGYSLEVDVTTTDLSLGATDYYVLEHRIEGYNFRPFAQRGFTLSFWVMSPKTGVHSIGLKNAGLEKAFVGEYTVTAADTWEYKTVVVPASPSAGTWDYTDGIGLGIQFTLAVGANTGTTTGAWGNQAYPVVASASHVNAMDSTLNFFRLTGVKMEIGSVATPIQFVPFEEELARAQRYYEKSFSYATTPAQNVAAGKTRHLAGKAGATAQFSPTIFYRVRKRTNVNPALYNPSAANAQARDESATVDCSATSISDNSEYGFAYAFTGNAATAVGNVISINWTTDAELY